MTLFAQKERRKFNLEEEWKIEVSLFALKINLIL